MTRFLAFMLAMGVASSCFGQLGDHAFDIRLKVRQFGVDPQFWPDLGVRTINFHDQEFEFSNVPKAGWQTADDGRLEITVEAIAGSEADWADHWEVDVWRHNKATGQWEQVFDNLGPPITGLGTFGQPHTQYNAYRLRFYHDEAGHPAGPAGHLQADPNDPDGDGIPGMSNTSAGSNDMGGLHDPTPGGEHDGGLDTDGDGDADASDEDGDGVPDEADEDSGVTGFECIDAFLDANSNSALIQAVTHEVDASNHSIAVPIPIPGQGSPTYDITLQPDQGTPMGQSLESFRVLIRTGFMAMLTVGFVLSILEVIRQW